jgi:alpha/beta superfamily hydrolase
MTDAVLLPPYFAHGGGQHNRVISAIYDRLLATAVKPHRFDFSSVEESAAQAETLAQIEACDGPVLLIGYSFGAAVAATITHPAVAGWALIAPALVVPQFISPASPFRPPAQPPLAADPRPKLVVTAERDAWFGADVIDPLAAGWTACEQQTVPSADHFFAATTDDVADRAVTWAVAR